MVKLWEQEAAAWRLELDVDGEALALRMGDEARQMRVSLGSAGALTPELVRRAAAKAVQSMCRLGAESAAADVSVVAEKLGEAGVAALAQGAELARYQPKMWKEVTACWVCSPEPAPPLALEGVPGFPPQAARASVIARDRARAAIRFFFIISAPFHCFI